MVPTSMSAKASTSVHQGCPFRSQIEAQPLLRTLDDILMWVRINRSILKIINKGQ